MPEREAILLLALIFSAAGSWVVWVIANTLRRSRVARSQAEIQTRLLDKFTSQELASYLQSGAGQAFLNFAASEHHDPYANILRAIRAGIVIAAAGGCSLLLRFFLSEPAVNDVLLVIGSFALAIGLGLVGSGGASYALSKKWGLLERSGDRGAQ
jgi:hypothetical protein